jgi:glycosyltransferase involved in cell wall biosynthesis
MKEKVSVVVPNYNYKKFISSRLDEIMGQTYPISEVIIIDDGSTDGSVDAIKEKVALLKEKYPDVNFETVLNEKNSGSVFSQWQKGVKMASGDYIWIAEADDSSSSKFLETVMAPMVKDKRVALSYTNSKSIGQVSSRDRLRKVVDVFRRHHGVGDYVVSGREEIEKNLAVFNSIPNVSACVFKNTPSLVEYLKETKKYKLSGDWYFYLKVAGQGKIAYSHKRLNHHRLSAGSVTGKTDFRTRFKELQQIHVEVLRTTKLSAATKKRIVESEIKLAKNWGLK